jgi:glycosyltransferase involved in cell wall biosynthesis
MKGSAVRVRASAWGKRSTNGGNVDVLGRELVELVALGVLLADRPPDGPNTRALERDVVAQRINCEDADTQLPLCWMSGRIDSTLNPVGAGDIGARGEHLSVVIPTYNCAPLLRGTLRSLAAQGDAIGEAEIVVVDDCSSDQPESVVAEFGNLRVGFVRHERNMGPCENFRACVQLASRPWIHLLHGDDVVLPQAYASLREAQPGDSETFAVFGRAVYIDENGSATLFDADGNAFVTQSLGPNPTGRLVYDPLDWRVCPVQFAGVLFSKRAIDAVGTFDCRFRHAQDWNLWWRMATTGRVAYTNAVVGGYRVFEGNHTSTLRRTAQNVDEYLVQLRLVEKYHRDVGGSNISRRDLYGPSFWMAHQQCLEFARSDKRAFWANLRRLYRWPRECRNWRVMAGLCMAAATGRHA